jgi:hypothetical protein
MFFNGPALHLFADDGLSLRDPKMAEGIGRLMGEYVEWAGKLKG